MDDYDYSIDVRRTVVDSIADILLIRPEAVIGEKTLASLGADSLDVIEIEMEIEKRLGFKDGLFVSDALKLDMTIDEIIVKAVNIYGEFVN